MRIIKSLILLVALFVLISCSSGGTSNTMPPVPQIISFSINGVKGNISGDKILINLPPRTDRTNLVATFVANSNNVSVNGVRQISGITKHDFTHSLIYIVSLALPTSQTQTVKAVSDLDSSTYTVTVNSPIIFITNGTYNGNLNGGSGADTICNNEAYTSVSKIPSGISFSSLLITATRFPCESASTTYGVCGNGHDSDWPLTANTIYYNPDNTPFNTVNSYLTFDGSNKNLEYNDGTIANEDTMFWMGIQSIYVGIPPMNPTMDIYGWAYDDCSSQYDGTQYSKYSAHNCSNFTSTDGYGTVGQAWQDIFPNGNPGEWGNYFLFSDKTPTGSNPPGWSSANIWSSYINQADPLINGQGGGIICDEPEHIVCVSN